MKSLPLFLLMLLTLLPQRVYTENPSGMNALVISKDMLVKADQTFESVVVLNGNVDFFGKTDRLVVINGKVKLESGSEIRKDMIVLGGQIEQLPGALVPETATAKKPIFSFLKNWREEFHSWWEDTAGEDWAPHAWLWVPIGLALTLSFVILLLAIGFILLSIAPGLSENADQILQTEPFASAIWGAVAYALFIPVIIFFAFSIVGIPLIPVFAFFAILILLAGLFSVSRLLGALTLKIFHVKSPMILMLTGLVLVFIVVSLPLVGSPLVFVLVMAGVGAVLRSIFDKQIKVRLQRRTAPHTFDI